MGKDNASRKKHLRTKSNDFDVRLKNSKELNVRANDEDMTVFISMARELKEEGNSLFQKRDFKGAIFKYGKALKLLPKNHIENAHLHSSLAACYMQKGPGEYKKAIEECELALHVFPKYSKALLKRARCYEALNRMDFALNDVENVLSFEPNNLMAQEIAERVRKVLMEEGSHDSEKGNLVAHECNEHVLDSPRNTSSKERSRKKKKHIGKTEDKLILEEQPISEGKMQNQKDEDKKVVEEQSSIDKEKAEDVLAAQELPEDKEEVMRTIKLVFGDDIRWALMPHNCSISDLRESVRNRFPSLKSVLLKYKDQEGDLVTITTTEELRWAEASADQQIFRIFIVEVDPEHDPFLFHKSENGIYTKNLEFTQNGRSSYIDDWIIEFAQLFKNQVGFDSDGYFELHDIGMKLHSEAIEDCISREDAQHLFDIAADKFQEMTALAFFNWGNVHLSRARKRVPFTEDSSAESVMDRVRGTFEWAEIEYEKAGKKYGEALAIKPDFYEGLLALGLQQFEQAKLTWHFAVEGRLNLDGCISSKVIGLFENAQRNIAKGMELWEEMEVQSLSKLSDREKGKNQLNNIRLDGLFEELTIDEAAELGSNMRSQINILWGTMLYERSNVEFKLGNDVWEDYLEASIERFKHAGVSPADIAVIVKNHCSSETAQEGIVFKIDEIVQAWNEIYDAKKWNCHLPSFRLEPLFRRRIPKLHHVLEHF